MRGSSFPVRVPTLFPVHPTQLGSAQAGFVAVFEVLCLMFSERVYKIHSKVTHRLFLDYFMFWIFPSVLDFHSFIHPFIKIYIETPSMLGKEQGSGKRTTAMHIVKKASEKTGKLCNGI